MLKCLNVKMLKWKGFTLVELLVVIAIISILSSIVFSNYRAGEQTFALQRSASKLAQDLRRAQEMAMSSKEFSGAPATFKGSYGIKFQIDVSTYLLFADLDEDGLYDLGEQVGSLLEIEAKISELSPSSPLTIVFTPPDPILTINSNPDISSATITLSTDSLQKTITINKAGLIEIK